MLDAKWKCSRVPVEIGRGSTGRVHAEYDERLRCHVAVKRLDPELARDPFHRRAFAVEASINGRLQHPNIVPSYRSATDDAGVPYFKSKLVQGTSLVPWLAAPAHSLTSADRLSDGIGLLLEVCAAAAYAHDHGVLHLDINPANIMVCEGGQAYLLDWSLAGLTLLHGTEPANGEPCLPEMPVPLGTPGYLAPEQARGNLAEIGKCSDVFGLGAVLYEIVSGQTPYGAHRSAELLLRQARVGAVVPIRSAVTDTLVPADLLDIVQHATMPSPGERIPSVTELQRALQAFVQ